MDGQQLDGVTKAAVAITAIAILSVLVPPISMAMALVSIGVSGTAIVQGRRAGTTNRPALVCLAVSVTLITLVVVGSAIYAAGN